MYYCNCMESYLAFGKEIPKRMKERGNDSTGHVLRFHGVTVTKDERCVHCGYYAFFSKVNPEEVERQNVVKIKEAEERWTYKQRLRLYS